jgi:hypothetical protein
MEHRELQKLPGNSPCFECVIAVLGANPNITTNSAAIASAYLEPAAIVKRP